MRRWKLLNILWDNGYQTGILFDLASGKNIDNILGKEHGVVRKKWWIFNESDYSYKNRILEAIIKELGLIKQ